MATHRFTALALRYGRRLVGLGALAALAAALLTATPASATTLWNQIDHAAARGTPSSSIQGIFSSFAADDFVVPSGERWRVKKVRVNGSYAGSGLPAGVNVQFSEADGEPGLPGTGIAGGNAVPAAGLSDPDYALTLDSPVTLRGGRTYWLVVWVRMGLPFFSDRQWFWTDRTVQSGNPAAWENPGDAFGTGCTSFAARAATCGIDPTAPDQAFRLLGKSIPLP